MNSTTKLPLNPNVIKECDICKVPSVHRKRVVILDTQYSICNACEDRRKENQFYAERYTVTYNPIPVRYKETLLWKGYNAEAAVTTSNFIVYEGVAWVVLTTGFNLEYIREHLDDFFTTEKPIKSVEMLDENSYHGKFNITLTDGTVTLLPYVNASNIENLTGYVAEPTESLPYSEPLKLGEKLYYGSSTGRYIDFTDQEAYDAAVTDGIALKGFFSNKINPNRKGELMLVTSLKDTCHQIVVTTKTSVYTIPIRVSISHVFQDALSIASVDYIEDIDGGTVTYPTYEDAAAVIAALPTEVTALDGAVNIPVSAWQDADTYNSSVPDVYTFRGTLAPNARFKVEEPVVTISVILKHDIVTFDDIEDIDGGTVASPTYEDAAAVIAALPTWVTADVALVDVPVETWVDTDTYNPAVVGSYTFTAVIGGLPAHVVNTTDATVTVEVVVAEA